MVKRKRKEPKIGTGKKPKGSSRRFIQTKILKIQLELNMQL